MMIVGRLSDDPCAFSSLSARADGWSFYAMTAGADVAIDDRRRRVFRASVSAFSSCRSAPAALSTLATGTATKRGLFSLSRNIGLASAYRW